jgi:hypothetical protein
VCVRKEIRPAGATFYGGDDPLFKAENFGREI